MYNILLKMLSTSVFILGVATGTLPKSNKSIPPPNDPFYKCLHRLSPDLEHCRGEYIKVKGGGDHCSAYETNVHCQMAVFCQECPELAYKHAQFMAVVSPCPGSKPLSCDAVARAGHGTGRSILTIVVGLVVIICLIGLVLFAVKKMRKAAGGGGSSSGGSSG